MNKSLALAHFQTSFQFITHQNERFSYLEGAYLALIGGCDWVQLRMKGATDEEVEPIARKLKLACEGAGATFILDDRVELVKKLQIDGVHLGKNDMPVDEVRKLLGDEFIIGGTANTFDDIRHPLNTSHSVSSFCRCALFFHCKYPRIPVFLSSVFSSFHFSRAASIFLS